jgi:omega-6 fatty acid desaturase (delta-12 desaturase)
MQDNKIKETLQNWRSVVRRYQKPDSRKAVIQLVTSFLPFIGIWALMYFSLNWSIFITIPLAAVAAFFLVRIFIIQHDCGHQSFTRFRKGNNVIGFIASLFSTIPYNSWSRTHNAHHAHNRQLEHRGLGDTFFLTTEEYQNRSAWKKFTYRVFRSPIVQFIIAPILYMTVIVRISFLRLKGWEKIKWAHLINNALLAVIYTLLALILGWQKFLIIQGMILMVFGVIAFWFFYIQHQHEENYNENKDNWNHLMASIKGSTFYKLPKLFNWLSGNIGYHHIHHLNPSIPNYQLVACAEENPMFNEHVNVLTFKDSLKCINHKLWDPQQKRMISFREYYSASR